MVAEKALVTPGATVEKEKAEVLLRIADIVFSFSSNRLIHVVRLEESYRDFFCTAEPEVIIHAHYNGVPQILLRDKDLVFDSEMIWSLYRTGEKHVIVLKTPVSGPDPYRIAVFDSNFKRGDVYSRIVEPGRSRDGVLPNPLEFPLSEVLMICLLAQGRGIMMHACGIDDGGCGYLFAGNSTHGKSTMARLWKDQAVVLNDDRIVLRQRKGRFWMYGTPWHGEYNGISPRGVPLKKVFFLRHSNTNSAHRTDGITAASKILTRSFPPFWEKTGMRFTLDFCAQLVKKVPCYELGFAPDHSILDLVRCVK